MMSIATLVAVVLLYLPAEVRGQEIQQDTLKVALDSTSRENLTKKELRELKQDERFKAKVAERERRDSIKFKRDSIKWSQPRILNSYLLEDSLQYRRLISWNHDPYFNNIELIEPDTTFNQNIYDYPFMRKDVGVTYLGVAGSAVKYHNYFKQQRLEIFEPFAPYLPYSHTLDDLPFYNVKSPYTELAYWGTLFANRDKEESNIKFMHTQNLSPALNLNFTYNRYGGNGLVPKEETDNRTVTFTSNYLGERYAMHSGFIYQGVKRGENGGIVNDKMVLDTTLEDTKDLAYRLQEAENQLKRRTLFLTHSYGVPIRWKKDDTLSLGEGTITYFGHSFEYSNYSKNYRDEIALGDSIGRALYNNTFLISPTHSHDSIRASILENRLFIRIQPWAKEAIVSKLDGGVGHQLMSTYSFTPEYYIEGAKNNNYNNLFLFFGSEGNFKRYFRWGANAKYNLSGYYANDFSLEGVAGVSLYPHKEGIHLTAKINLENRTPNWFNNYHFSNHYQWDNNFNKITESKFEAKLELPRYKLKAFVGYSLIDNPLYFGTQAIIAQERGITSIFAASIEKKFKLGFLHLDNRVLFQMSSNREIIPLPELSANLRYYAEFELVKNVLRAQFGADVTFNTPYYAQAYNPALGIFYNQNERKIGNYPYLDAFVNLQWKRASIFVKYLNATQGWPSGDYFSAHHYIRPVSTFKFGIHWPFYVK